MKTVSVIFKMIFLRFQIKQNNLKKPQQIFPDLYIKKKTQVKISQ